MEVFGFLFWGVIFLAFYVGLVISIWALVRSEGWKKIDDITGILILLSGIIFFILCWASDAKKRKAGAKQNRVGTALGILIDLFFFTLGLTGIIQYQENPTVHADSLPSGAIFMSLSVIIPLIVLLKSGAGKKKAKAEQGRIEGEKKAVMGNNNGKNMNTAVRRFFVGFYILLDLFIFIMGLIWTVQYQENPTNNEDLGLFGAIFMSCSVIITIICCFVYAARKKKVKTEQERIAKDKAEQIRIANLKAEKERFEREKAEKERLAKVKAEQERLAREKAEKERLAKVKAEQERLAREKAEQERKAKENAEYERLAREKAEQERKAKENAEYERLAREKAEQERKAKENAEYERIAREKAVAEKRAKEVEEENRAAREKAAQKSAADSGQIFCGNCGKPLFKEAAFCMFCGTKRQDMPDNAKTAVSADTVVFEEGKCPVCGGIIEKSDSECGKCGFPIISLSTDPDQKETDKIKKYVLDYRHKFFQSKI